MNTAERLEKMTDRGKFERLANAVLGKDNRNYAAVIALGINAQNETIKGPSDGFWQIPGSEPPHFVWVQHTTTDRNRLKGKWLNEDGDFIKSGKAASQLRKDFLDAQFTVALSTNQRIPDESLAIAVYKKANELNIKVDIWEQSRYTRFLDSHRDGQYLRKTFLGTDAEMMSPDLLAELCKKSLEMYKREQFTNPDSWISRGLDDRVSKKMGDTSCKVKLLVGESGFGKSVAAYRFLEKHLKSGRYGLFIPDSIIQVSVSLEDALGQILYKLYPTLLSKESSLIHEIIPSGSQFVIVVDDVNRAGNPQKLIRNLTNWAKSPYLVVCPVWPRFQKQLFGVSQGQGIGLPNSLEVQRKDPEQVRDSDISSLQTPREDPQKQVQDIEHKLGIDIIDVDRMLVEEGRRAVESVASVAGLEISSIEAYSIAGGLGNDPYLIGAFGDLLRGAKHKGFENLVQNTIAKLIAKRLNDVTLANDRYFEHEYRQALLTLTSCMLRHKKLYPHWNKVESWLLQSGKHLDTLRALCGCEKLCHISAEGKFNFQHDRLLEYFCVESIVEFLSDPDKNADVLTEPYYAEMIGQALLRSPQSDLILNMVQDKLPLALVSAVRFMGDPSTDYHQSIARKVKDWVRVYAGPYNSSTPESIRGAVAFSFLRMDSSVVLETVNTSFGLEKRWLGGFARFRNGDARGAIEYCSIFGTRGVEDASLFTELVEHAKLHHREQLTQGLTQLLRSPDTKQELAGAPVLAGFLGLGELQNVIPDWWEQVTNKSKYLTDTLWAALRCSNNLYQDEFLDSLMACWANDLNKQTSVAEWLSSALSLYADKNLIDYLISQGVRYKSLRLPIAYICGRVDLPNSIEFAVRVCAERDDELEWRSIGHWASFDQPKLSHPSVMRLQDIWNDSRDSDLVRELAFRLWIKNVDHTRVNVLELVQTISPTEPFFKNAIWQRAWLGDETCTPNLISILESDTYFFRVAHRVWCNEIIPVAEKHLRLFKDNIPRDFSGGKLDEHYNLTEMLKAIPIEIAERLLIKHWEWLRYSCRFVQSALFVGTPQCLELAEAAIAEYPASIDTFKHIDQFFGIFAWGHALSVETITPPITLQRIQNLQPHLHRLDELALSSFAAVCYLLGEKGIEWCRKYFPDSVDAACRKRYIPTEEDLVQTLDMYSDNHSNMMIHWLDEFKKRGDSRNPMGILGKWWLESEPTFKKFQAVARCIEVIGEREDLKLLDVPFKYPIEQQMAETIRASVTFAVRRRTLE